MNPINFQNSIPLPPLTGPTAAAGSGASSSSDGPSFKDFLLNSIQQVNSMQQDADKAVEEMFTGGDTDPATVLTAVQKADMAFRMMMQIRNKLSSAYDEFKNIRI
ncbi:MAG TPA: flagellar hook-basal body complex protein FliE [Pirellulales bacterium]|jgi:flagellar hook-basal body complex protein FliE|nr:flagellar hook-basal body complex protein FliE [Pirellulales bacterium]